MSITEQFETPRFIMEENSKGFYDIFDIDSNGRRLHVAEVFYKFLAISIVNRLNKM